jgi:hypothetical protein
MRTPIALVCLALAGAGCFGSGSNPGALGHYDFSYTSCLFGCTLDNNSMAAGGARTTIDATPHTGVSGFVSVQSSNSLVASFARGGQANEVTATSGQAGLADLMLLDGAGKELDRATVIVKNTDTLQLDQGWSTAAPGISVLAGRDQVFHVTTLAGGQTTIGTGSVTFTLGGGLIPGGGITFGDEAIFRDDGTGAGGSITAACPNAQADVPIAFVPSAAITAAPLTPSALTFSRGQDAGVTQTASAGQTAVFGAPCAWTLVPATGLTVSGGSSTSSSSQVNKFTFHADQPGSWTATCAIGTFSTTLAVTVN